MKKVIIILIVIALSLTLGIVLKETGYFEKLARPWISPKKAEKTIAVAEEAKPKPEPEAPIVILDMDGFVIPVVKGNDIIASMELSFKVLIGEEYQAEFNIARSVLRAKMTSMIYDYIDKYYSSRMDLEKMKSHMLTRLRKEYGKKKIRGLLFAFYYIRPAA